MLGEAKKPLCATKKSPAKFARLDACHFDACHIIVAMPDWFWSFPLVTSPEGCCWPLAEASCTRPFAQLGLGDLAVGIRVDKLEVDDERSGFASERASPWR